MGKKLLIKRYAAARGLRPVSGNICGHLGGPCLLWLEGQTTPAELKAAILAAPEALLVFKAFPTEIDLPQLQQLLASGETSRFSGGILILSSDSDALPDLSLPFRFCSLSANDLLSVLTLAEAECESIALEVEAITDRYFESADIVEWIKSIRKMILLRSHETGADVRTISRSVRFNLEALVTLISSYPSLMNDNESEREPWIAEHLPLGPQTNDVWSFM